MAPVVALSRYGGIRVPSELLTLTWADVDRERSRFRVHAPKTEHHKDGGDRWVPIFPELRPHLEVAFELAPEGAVYLIPASATRIRTCGRGSPRSFAGLV
jgi:integrase